MASVNPPDDPQEYRSHVRQRILEKSLSIPNDKQSDIDQNVREIRAVLKTNAEILDRCIPSVYSCSRSQQSPNNSLKTTFFMRDFNLVNISHEESPKTKRRKIAHASSSSSSDDSSSDNFDVDTSSSDSSTSSTIEKTVISIISRPTTKTFNTSVLINLPDTLAKFIRPTFKYANVPGRKVSIDYEEYFDNSLTLHDDVLARYLVHLKEHLMSVQVCLGEIDTWLMGSDESRRILREIFGDISCLDTDTTKSDKKRIYMNSMTHVLKEFIVSGDYNAKFDISVEKERQRLKKFIEFLSINLDSES